MLTMLVLAAALVVAASIAGLAYVIAAKRAAGPTRELAAAVRLLDKILAYDDAVTALAPDHRAEAIRITANYNKELDA